MEYYTLARVLHVLAVIIWIGGVGMVTMVIIPAIKRMKSAEDQIQTFEQIEGRFAFVAKTMTILTAATGFTCCTYSMPGVAILIQGTGGCMP